MNREKVISIGKDVAGFVLVTAAAFLWWLLVLLLIGFIALSVLHFTIEGIFAGAIAGTLATDLFYVIRTIKKHRRAAEEEWRKNRYN